MIYLVAQSVPDPADVMEAAKSTGDWAVMLLCFLVITMVVGFVLLVRMLLSQTKSQIDSLTSSHKSQLESLTSVHSNRIEQLIKEGDQQRADASAREERMGSRIDKLENLNAQKLTEMVEKMLELMTKVETTLASFSMAQNTINGDLKKLCSLLELSPCLALSKARGKYRIVDEETGMELYPGSEDVQG